MLRSLAPLVRQNVSRGCKNPKIVGLVNSFNRSLVTVPLVKTQNLSLKYSKSFLSTKVGDVETLELKAETKQLLDIVTHSIYTDKEVFLRELISNASDALEKLRYKQVINEVHSTDEPLGITITADKEAKTLVITDNGIGMSKDDLINNLGTIARSGSKQFVESLKKGSADDAAAAPTANPHGIIGQFGVGFYSSFMIAGTVDFESVPATAVGAESAGAYKWSSDGSGSFTVTALAH